MARIRTIKPEFFRHEGLQDLAATHGAHVMLVFAGLWGHCDKAGRFEWKPRTLKLDILPFLEFDMAATLDVLLNAGLLTSYMVAGKRYGLIESFQEHQRITGKEAEQPEKFPPPPVKQQGNTGETPGKHPGAQEGKGREEERKDSASQPTSSAVKPLDLKTELWKTTAAFLTARGVPDARARSFVGSLRKDHPDVAILNAFAAAESEATPDPIPFIKAVLAGKVKHAGQSRISDHPLGIFGQLAEELRPLPRARG